MGHYYVYLEYIEKITFYIIQSESNVKEQDDYIAICQAII